MNFYNIEIVELPIEWVHKEGSKLNLFTDPIKMILDLLILRFRKK